MNIWRDGALQRLRSLPAGILNAASGRERSGTTTWLLLSRVLVQPRGPVKATVPRPEPQRALLQRTERFLSGHGSLALPGRKKVAAFSLLNGGMCSCVLVLEPGPVGGR